MIEIIWLAKPQIFPILSFPGKGSDEHIYLPLLAADVFKPPATGLRAVRMQTTAGKRATDR